MTKVGGLPIWYTGKQPRRKRRWSPSRQQKRHCAGVDKGRFFPAKDPGRMVPPYERNELVFYLTTCSETRFQINSGSEAADERPQAFPGHADALEPGAGEGCRTGRKPPPAGGGLTTGAALKPRAEAPRRTSDFLEITNIGSWGGAVRNEARLGENTPHTHA